MEQCGFVSQMYDKVAVCSAKKSLLGEKSYIRIGICRSTASSTSPPNIHMSISKYAMQMRKHIQLGSSP